MMQRIMAMTLMALLALGAGFANAQSFAVDDDPFVTAGGFGYGAEDPYGLILIPGLGPSPILGILGATDSSILAPGPVLQHPGGNGQWVDSLSTLKKDLGMPIQLLFSVDRVSTGAPGTAVAIEAGFNQQPADVYTSTDAFAAPGTFAGTLGPGPFAGVLPTSVGGPPSNVLTTDDSVLGLLVGGGILPPGVAGPPITPGTHDNLDEFDSSLVDAAPPDGLFDLWTYFTVYPDEAVLSGLRPADIIDIPAGAPGGATAPPFAAPPTMGLDIVGGPLTDSIDALILFDNNLLGGPANGGPGAEPGIDFALFSLAPGSLSLAFFGLDAADVFFTDFTGAFALYAPSPALGLAGAPGGAPGAGDNIDALEFRRVICGNGILEPTEQCDDGNTASGDCCDSSCQAEPSSGPCLDTDGNACTTAGCDGLGVCDQNHVFAPLSTPCEADADLCTDDQCNGSGACVFLADVTCATCEMCDPVAGCVVAPMSTCRAPVVPLRAMLFLKNNGDDSRDKLIWKWIKGEETNTVDFGNPVTTDDYTLCIYEDGGASLLLASTAPAGGLCAGKDCWKAKGTKGFKYTDKERTPEGLDTILLKSGVDERAKIIVKGKGANLSLPSPLDVELPVTVQLQSTNGECWGADFFDPGVRKNEPDSFKAKAGSPSGAFLDVTSGLLD